MTDSEHAELSAQLAKALGWPAVIVGAAIDPSGVFVNNDDGSGWQAFDYRSPDVYGPLIEWLGGVHGITLEVGAGRYCWYAHDPFKEGYFAVADTLPEAVARAVIATRRHDQPAGSPDTPVTARLHRRLLRRGSQQIQETV